ncbi:MAG TPA: beta-ketoacyl synthase chain length factor [Cytophagaceae bacterium]|jgi:3-oxoacyl-(acyl-carrier-protein) synthase
MDIFINATSNISPQNTFDEKFFLEEIVEYNSQYLQCIQPDYKNFIDPKASRRMGRILKMGTTAALKCLSDSTIQIPDAIITGTGFGCLEDTINFLDNLIENNEQFLTPTSFIQSTHNTLSAQVALLLGCNNYNFTYVHRGISFESALADAMMSLKEKTSNNVLVGAADEIVEKFFNITSRMGIWKEATIKNTDLLLDQNTGTIAGEGATFFVLSTSQEEDSYCKVQNVKTFYKPDMSMMSAIIEEFLKDANLSISDLDLVLLGYNGDPSGDEIYNELVSTYLTNQNVAYFKHLCGEYHTASAFATWFGAKVLKHQEVPLGTRLNDFQGSEYKNLLIYNHYASKNHSLILLTKC